MKRFVRTRNGDSVVSKLEQDVYILMSVLEGGEFSELKDIIAKGKSNRTQSQAQTPLRASNMASIDSSNGVAKLRTDIRLLKDSVRDIQDSLDSVNSFSTNSNTRVFGKSKKTAYKNKVSQNPVPSSTVSMSEQSLNSVLMNEQSVGLAEHVPTYVAQEVDSAISDNQNNGDQFNISEEHLTAEPELASVHHNMKSGVDAGHVACGTEGPFYYNVGAVS